MVMTTCVGQASVIRAQWGSQISAKAPQSGTLLRARVDDGNSFVMLTVFPRRSA